MSIEIFAPSRGMLLLDPFHDAVRAVCYAVEAQEGPYETKVKEHGVILWVSEGDTGACEAAAKFCIESSQVAVRIAASEHELFEKMVEVVNYWDPDFLTGFEVQKTSIGYLVDRASQLDVRPFESACLSALMSYLLMCDLPLLAGAADQFDSSHLPPSVHEHRCAEPVGSTWSGFWRRRRRREWREVDWDDVGRDEGVWALDPRAVHPESVAHGSIRGVFARWLRLLLLRFDERVQLSISLADSSQVKLSRYAFEDVHRAVLKREFPIYSPSDLSSWYTAGGQPRWKVLRYFLQRASLNLQMLSRMQLVTRTRCVRLSCLLDKQEALHAFAC